MSANRNKQTHPLRRWGLWTPVFLYCLVIFIQSSFRMAGVLPPIDFIDLVIHAAVYGVLGLLMARAIDGEGRFRSRWAIWAIASALTATYGVSDEIHQWFVPGRHCDGWDMLADAVGGSTGAGIWLGVIGGRPAEKRPFPR